MRRLWHALFGHPISQVRMHPDSPQYAWFEECGCGAVGKPLHVTFHP